MKNSLTDLTEPGVIAAVCCITSRKRKVLYYGFGIVADVMIYFMIQLKHKFETEKKLVRLIVFVFEV